MLEIIYHNKKLYINLDLLKAKLKKLLIAILSVAAVVFGVVGALYIFADAKDDTTIMQMFLKFLIGAILCAVSYVICVIKSVVR